MGMAVRTDGLVPLLRRRLHERLGARGQPRIGEAPPVAGCDTVKFCLPWHGASRSALRGFWQAPPPRHRRFNL